MLVDMQGSRCYAGRKTQLETAVSFDPRHEYAIYDQQQPFKRCKSGSHGISGISRQPERGIHQHHGNTGNPPEGAQRPNPVGHRAPPLRLFLN